MENSITTLKGLNLDVSPEMQPDGTYRFALNAINTSINGDYVFLSTELGTDVYSSLPVGFFIIGRVIFTKNEFALILHNPTTNKNEIGIVNKNKVYTQIINSDCLNFNLQNQVQGLYKIINGCERVLYLVGKTYNPLSINIDKLDQYLLDGETIETANTSGTGWDCGKLKLFKDFSFAKLTDIIVNDFGGSLSPGKYFFFIQYTDLQLNSTSWFGESFGVPIYDDLFLNSPYSTIDGVSMDSMPPTTKSITLNIDNIDTSYNYLNIGIVAAVGGVKSGFIYRKIPITNSSQTVLITSIDTLEEEDLEQFALPNVVLDEVQHITEIEDRLIVANTAEKYIDFAVFQQMANDIQTRYVVKEVAAQSTTEDSQSPKSPGYFLNNMSQMRDEVYKIGIEWIFKDGYVSPVFHIPSRQKDKAADNTALPTNTEPNNHYRDYPISGWDSTYLSVSYDGKYLGPVGTVVQRWQLYNTALKDSSPVAGYASSGELAYWESNLAYPDVLDKAGNRVYPEGNIRYHKMPDNTLEPHFRFDGNDQFIKTLGLEFKNIQAPPQYSNQIAGYRIMVIPRDITNKSVLDKGIVSPCVFDIEETEVSQNWGVSINATTPGFNFLLKRDIVGFQGPETKFEHKALNAAYLKSELNLVRLNISYQKYGTTPENWAQIVTYNDFLTPSPTAINAFTDRTITKKFYMLPDSTANNVLDVAPFGTIDFNNIEQQEIYVTQLEDEVPLTYLDETAPYDLSAEGSYPSTGYDAHSSTWYSTLKRYTPEQYGDVYKGEYRQFSKYVNTYTGSTTSIIEFGGDTFISLFRFRKNWAGDEAILFNPGVISNDPATAMTWSRSLVSFFVESTINVELRNEGPTNTDVYYPKSYNASIYDFIELETTLSVNDLIPNYYDYNTDYSTENVERLNLSPSSNYDYTSECSNSFPNNIHYSEKSTPESLQDAYNTFLFNNYRVVGNKTGEITNIFVKQNKLYAQTQDNIFLVPTGSKQLSIDDANVFIGTGDFFSLAPIELVSLEQGYGGTRQKWAVINTEVGTVIVDDIRRVVYFLSDNLKDIGGKGLKKYTFANLKLYYEEAVNLLLQDTIHTYTNVANPANPGAIGFNAVYDSENKRVIISKRDYLPLFTSIRGIKTDAIIWQIDDIAYNPNTQEFEVYTNLGFKVLSLLDKEYFEDKSFTLSYSLLSDSWISWHSYIPLFMFATQSYWFTYPNRDNSISNNLYRHNYGDTCLFYQLYDRHIVELTIPTGGQNIIWYDITLNSDAKEFEAATQMWKPVKNKTFNKVWIYNETQSTGLKNLVVENTNSNNPFYDVIGYNSEDIPIERVEHLWRLNKFLDFVDQSPVESNIATSHWDYRKELLYIDKVPNPNIHNENKSQYDLQPFRDKYITVRLIQDLRGDEVSIDNVQLTTRFIIPELKISDK